MKIGLLIFIMFIILLGSVYGVSVQVQTVATLDDVYQVHSTPAQYIYDDSQVDAGLGRIIGLRYRLFVPNGTQINNAYLRVNWGDSRSGNIYTKIFAEPSNNAAAYTTISTSGPHYRSKTTNSVDWDVASTTLYSWANSSNISRVVQEITDRSGWVSGNYINILIDDDGANQLLRLFSFDFALANAPYLIVDYSNKTLIVIANLSTYVFNPLGTLVASNNCLDDWSNPATVFCPVTYHTCSMRGWYQSKINMTPYLGDVHDTGLVNYYNCEYDDCSPCCTDGTSYFWNVGAGDCTGNPSCNTTCCGDDGNEFRITPDIGIQNSCCNLNSDCNVNGLCITSGQEFQGYCCYGSSLTRSCLNGSSSCFDSAYQQGNSCYYGENCQVGGYTPVINDSNKLCSQSICTASGWNNVLCTCNLTSVVLTSNCGNNCSAGETVSVNAQYTGICPAAAYVVVYAQGGTCSLNYTLNLTKGINTTCTSSGNCAQWIVPSISSECLAQTVSATTAELYSNNFPGQGGILNNSQIASGTFTFWDGCPALTTLCPDGVCRNDCGPVVPTCDYDGVCDSQESCLCSPDCDNRQDSCQSGLLCEPVSHLCKYLRVRECSQMNTDLFITTHNQDWQIAKTGTTADLSSYPGGCTNLDVLSILQNCDKCICYNNQIVYLDDTILDPYYDGVHFYACSPNASDTAYCNISNDCVYKSQCYRKNTYLNVDTDSIIEYCDAWIEVFENCTNLIDDDGDSQIDLNDVDCNAIIRGFVFDTETTPISSASINALGKRNFITTSSINGFYFLSVRSNSSYDIIADKNGYVPQTAYGLFVQPQQVRDINFSLGLTDDVCKTDCTLFGKCEPSCQGKNGCEFYSSLQMNLCNGKLPDFRISYNTTHEIMCCNSEPYIAEKFKPKFEVSARNVIIYRKIVLYEGKLVNLVVSVFDFK